MITQSSGNNQVFFGPKYVVRVTMSNLEEMNRLTVAVLGQSGVFNMFGVFGFVS